MHARFGERQGSLQRPHHRRHLCDLRTRQHFPRYAAHQRLADARKFLCATTRIIQLAAQRSSTARQTFIHHCQQTCRSQHTHQQMLEVLGQHKKRIRHLSVAALPRGRAQREIDRYCVWPGQACSYKLGHTEWVRLRSLVQARAGGQFALDKFHDVLREGPMPLVLLEEVLRRTWRLG